MKKPITHAPLNYFKTKDNILQINNTPLPQVIARAGQTPLYIYDRQLMTERVQQLRQQLPEQIKIHYAMKANPMPAVVQHMANITDGIDVASHNEMLTALDTGIPAEHISYAGPGKTDKDLTAAIAANVTLNVESINELKRIEHIGTELNLTPQIALRINPDFELKASGMKMAGGAKPFGIDAELVPDIIKTLPQSIDLIGLHIFCGSQNLNAQAIIEAHQHTFELASKLAQLAPAPLKFINIGGGFGIPYFPGDTPLAIEPIAHNLQTLIEQHPLISNSDIILELGRYLVGEAGIYVCQVVDKKISREQTYLITNGGLHHHLANSGNFGQVIRKNYPVIIGNNVGNEHLEQAHIVGPSCTPLDVIAHNMSLPKASINDYIVVLQSGAYGLTASPNQFLSHPNAIEILV
ncbi:MAG: pyridoxal-dependent decarboxylase, exosortase A system-associated [Methylococcales bacterium]|nr:pyridoxal-dependent decarboxylase, exosortase A system-associated [Methylococcales bacterium]MBT7443392.1 pyridoxal-dependent decarboxylase, exosortase A system-associated [Methylococcales bacterium]